MKRNELNKLLHLEHTKNNCNQPWLTEVTDYLNQSTLPAMELSAPPKGRGRIAKTDEKSRENDLFNEWFSEMVNQHNYELAILKTVVMKLNDELNNTNKCLNSHKKKDKKRYQKRSNIIATSIEIVDKRLGVIEKMLVKLARFWLVSPNIDSIADLKKALHKAKKLSSYSSSGYVIDGGNKHEKF